MLSITFAESMRLQFADSYEKDGPAEMLQGSGIMNYHLVKESGD